MTRFQNLQSLLRRDRHAGDLVFAVVALAVSLFLLSRLGTQVKWSAGKGLLAQPGFWTAVGLIGMCGFSLMHVIGGLCSPRNLGRWSEVAFWIRAGEFVLWFALYVVMVPLLGYLPATILAMIALTWRSGYRSWKFLTTAALSAFVVVVVFKSILAVKIPGGALYEFLPSGLRKFMLINF